MARRVYAEATKDHPDEPSFDALIQDHWFRVVWGRISIPFDISRAAKAKAAELTALNSFIESRFATTYSFDAAAHNNTEISETAAAIERGDAKLNSVECQTPSWVAARLWDRARHEPTDRSADLKNWVDRWHILGSPRLNPPEVWADAHALAFWEATLEVFEKAGLANWDQMRAGFVGQVSLIRGRPASESAAFVPEVPTSLIDRALWLETPAIERFVMDSIWSVEDISGLVSLALIWIERAQHAQAPHPFAAKLLALAIENAELFEILLSNLRHRPKLLADVLLNPPTSALGCFLVGRWESPGGAWDRELANRADEASKATAFADAVSVMGWFLQQGTLPPCEAAALLRWVYSKLPPGFIDDNQDVKLAALRDELVGQSFDILSDIAEHLMKPSSAVGAPEFSAAIDVIGMGNLSHNLDPQSIVATYRDSLSRADYGLSAHSLGVIACGTLVDLTTSVPELRQLFLYPFDIKARLTEGADENPFTLEDHLSKSLRVHIRVLCRAIAGSASAPDQGLVDALVFAVKAGAQKQLEKGRVPAFAPRHEVNIFGTSSDRPIAADLGAALSVLWDEQRTQLLAATLQTDEPMVLAQLLAFAPVALHEQIKARIEAIRPEDAGETYSLFEAQARIDALLSGRAPKAALRFIKEEEGLQTFGKAPGRELARLRSELRLLLIEGKWSEIREATLPEELSDPIDPSASDTLYFYKALAALNDPAGDSESAEQAFTRLHERRPDVAAYVINVFAARISLVLAGNFFGELAGDALRRGNQLLAEAEEMLSHTRGATAEDLAIFDKNKAILLLALRKPQPALEILSLVRGIQTDDTAAAYMAVALARLGQTSDALAALDKAKSAAGDTAILQAARAHIESGHGFTSVADTSTNEDPLPRIKLALWELSQLDPFQQASAFRPPPNGFFSFVLDQVRFAAASLTALVPMMRSITLEAREDDLNALIGQLLAARIHFLSWVVPDQTLGGFTAASNPGERDLVLRRDSAELAVIEAVICENSIDSGNLTKHFKKLFAYSSCRLFFHLTYSYLDNRLSDLMQALKNIAEREAPAPFAYRTLQILPSEDSRPAGFIAKYGIETDEATVVFLVLDMGQSSQRNAAKALLH